MAGVRRRLGMFVLLLLLIPSSAAAHSSRVETNPEHGATLETLPAEATVTFNEAPKTADVVLARPDGKVDKLKTQVVGSTVKVRLPANGPRGAYTLSYRVVSADGHPVSGSVTFRVTAGPAASTAGPEASTTTATATPRAEPGRGPIVPIVLGIAALGVAAALLVARSLRR
jgi:methionine-rich copper-binding protein CopC